MTTLRIHTCILAYRREHSMSQAEFGGLLGVSAQSVSKWEHQLCCPDITLLPALARVLGVSLEYLLGADKAP